MRHGTRLAIGFAVLLGCFAAPAFGGVPEHERVLITDPAVLESMGFRADARHVYMRKVTARARKTSSKPAISGHRSLHGDQWIVVRARRGR